VQDREGGGASFRVTLSADPGAATTARNEDFAQPTATALSSSEASQA